MQTTTGFALISDARLRYIATVFLMSYSGFAVAKVSSGAVEFAIGNVEFVLLHELAHVLIGDYDIPILGPEELAADYFATAVLASDQRSDAARAERARQTLLATANGLASAWEKRIEIGLEKPYWESHGLTIQRFYNIVCLTFGSNPEVFPRLPEQVGMPRARADGCPAEFARVERAVEWLRTTYGQPDKSEAGGTGMEILFETPPTAASRQAVQTLKNSRALEKTLQSLQEKFVFKEPIQIVFKSCRSAEAAWVPSSRQIVFCYRLLDAYVQLGQSRATSQRQKQLSTIR
ncbi:MAG: DUF4344 domain-containing metallopeptidase [Gammaproteobacteria bacterium]|nr:DUF4344 domain-containing metallopeptidase [Gammaproteobacteria bacterium]